MPLPTYREDRWPVLVVRMPVAGMSPQEMRAHASRVRSYCERGEAFAMVIDTREAPAPDAATRRALAEHIKSLDKAYPGRIRGSAIIASSTLQRGVLTAVQWLTGHNDTMTVVASVEEGVVWARALLEREG